MELTQRFTCSSIIPPGLVVLMKCAQYLAVCGDMQGRRKAGHVVSDERFVGNRRDDGDLPCWALAALWVGPDL